MHRSRRNALLGLAAAACAPLRDAFAQEAWPQRSVRIINPWPAGGPADALVRPAADGLRALLGQNFVVENQAGANGTIATATVAKAAPDGYTLLFSHLGPMTVSPSMTKLPYDPIRDFAPITQFTSSPLVLTVRHDLPVNTLAEFIAYMRAQSKPLIMGSVGNGSTTHIVAEMLKAATGLDYVNVPYKGSEPLLVDLAGGRVDYSFLNHLGTMAYVKAGKVRVIASTSLKRSPLTPDLPTFSEVLPGFEMSAWYGLHAPAATPPPLLDAIHKATVKVLTSDDYRERMRQGWFDLVANTPQEFEQRVRTDLDKFTRLVKTSGMSMG